MKMFAKVLAFIAICSASLTAMAYSDAQRAAIAERLKPVGSVCLAGDSSCAVASAAVAGGGAKSGEEIYNTNCMACHSTGAAGAPKKGDADAWSARLAARDLDTIYQHAIAGYNGMPAKGLCMSCSDDDIKHTVDYILAQSGQ